MDAVFLVASLADKIIVDRVYDNFADAMIYCDSRRNDTYDCAVYEADFGDDWHGWRQVHITKRKATQ